MSDKSETQCYFIQLQIDSYLDGDLGETQCESFMAHVQQCQDCGNEFRYAQKVQDSILDLPLLDCEEQVLEPIHRLSAAGKPVKEAARNGFWSQLTQLIGSIPLPVRYAVPVTAALVFAVTLLPSLLAPQQALPGLAGQSALEAEPQYSTQEVVEALAELNMAIDYLHEVTQRTEVMIEDRFLIRPLQDSLNASFERAGKREASPLGNDPI